MRQYPYKRLTAWLLAWVMVMTMLPTMALATEEGSVTEPPAAAETTVVPEVSEPEASEPPAEAEPPAVPEPPTEAEPPTESEPPAVPEPPAETEPPTETEPPAETEAAEDLIQTEEQSVSQSAMLAGPSTAFGIVSLYFGDWIDDSKRVTLKGYQYITECSLNAEVKTVEDEFGRQAFITTGDYVAYFCGTKLYLKGNLSGACIDLQHVDDLTPKVIVQEDTTMSGNHAFIYAYEKTVELIIPEGKTLTMNAQRPGAYKYPVAISARGDNTNDVWITGRGTLNINYNGTAENGSSPVGIRAGKVVIGGEPLLSDTVDYGPTVNIKMNNGGSGPEGDAMTGIQAGTLTVKDGAKLNIEVTGRALNTSNNSNTGEGHYGGNGGRVNMAISATQMKLLNDASVDITSHANVMSDIRLWGSGEVLTVDTTGHLNILNEGNIQRYDPEIGTEATLAMYRDYPTDNIYFSDKNATANLVRAEGGVSITSYSAAIDDWYDDYYTKGEEDADNWAISGGTADPTLGQNMHRGSLRIGESVKLADNRWIRNWGSIEYIYAPQGVATVQRSKGLIMRWEKPEGNPQGSSLYFAKVLRPELNDIHVVRKGESIELTSTGTKGTFLYWYDAQHPEGSGSGTSWTSATQTFSNIQQDMVLVPVYDPMKNGPTLSDVGYSVQWDDGVTKQTRYAYQDMTFAKADNISTTGRYEVMLVPAQLPQYGEKTYAVKDLKGSPLMRLCSARLYADKNAKFSTDALGNWFFNIPPGSYRIACVDDDSNYCFISKPFTFDPPVAPPYISPDTKIEDTGGTKTVTITAERGAPIKYRLWDYTKNKWGGYNLYNGPFDVTVTADQDVRIEAYAGAPILNRRSEVHYAVRPTGKPMVKYGDKEIGDSVRRYFYGSIDLTVEVPEGYEVWYRVDYQPSESEMGTKVENGKVTVTDSGSHGILYFKLAKAFTVDGVTYRKLSHQETTVHLSKLDELPAPKVTVTTKEGGQTLIPSGNTYTMTENVVTVELSSQGNWPLNATLAYDTNGNATPRLSQSYTKPFEVRGAGTIAVFTLVPDANGGYDYERAAYTFKLAENLEWVPVSTYNGDCTAYYTDENGVEKEITSFSQALTVGTRVRVVPNPPAKKAFKKWEISNYSEYSIWENPIDGPYNPELIFHVPKPINDPYNGQPKTLAITATFAEAAEASISDVTKVDLVMSKTVGESISLNYSNKAMRTISCQWWEGASVGAEDEALPGAVTFDPDKTYTVKVTIKANPGACFTTTSGVAIGSWGEHFTVPDDKIIGTYDTLTFTATPIRQIDLTMPAPLTVGDPLPTTAAVEGLPAGVTAQALEWPYVTGNTVPEKNDGTVRAALTLKTDGTRPILVGVGEYKNPLVNGNILCHYARNSSNNYVTDGSTVTVGNIDLPVKSLGVSVSGTAVSWNDTDDAAYLLYDGSTGDADIRAEWKAGSYTGTPCTDKGTPAASGKQFAQTFQFDTVAEGDYKLVILKPGKYVPKIVPITVGEAGYDCGQLKLWLYGDVNYDGKVNAADSTQVLRYFNAKSPNVFSQGSAQDQADRLLAANVNGDSIINAADSTQIIRYFNNKLPNVIANLP